MAFSSPLGKGQQVGAQAVLVGVGHAVRAAFIDLQFGMRHQTGHGAAGGVVSGVTGATGKAPVVAAVRTRRAPTRLRTDV